MHPTLHPYPTPSESPKCIDCLRELLILAGKRKEKLPEGPVQVRRAEYYMKGDGLCRRHATERLRKMGWDVLCLNQLSSHCAYSGT
jgi:hypothetical protein